MCIKGITLLLAALRLTFGGNTCPGEWGCISKTVADLATDILHCNEWDPSEIHSPLQHIMPEPKPLPPHILLAPAMSPIVTLPSEDHGKVNVYIDDRCIPFVVVYIKGITVLLASLRLTFGGKPCPSEWGCISDTVADLATNILHLGRACPQMRVLGRIRGG